MKILLLSFTFLFSISYAQNKKRDSNIIEKNIQECRIHINDSMSIFNIHQNLYNNEIKILLKTENVTKENCTNQTITKDDIKYIHINQNPVIEINKHFIKGLDILDFTNLIPDKLIAFKKKNFSIVILELYNFSYSNVGSGYIYTCFKLDRNGNVIEKKKIETKLPMQKNKYLRIF